MAEVDINDTDGVPLLNSRQAWELLNKATRKDLQNIPVMKFTSLKEACPPELLRALAKH